jgi:PBP1b-binding outer membrane lipoprotein LpoB
MLHIDINPRGLRNLSSLLLAAVALSACVLQPTAPPAPAPEQPPVVVTPPPVPKIDPMADVPGDKPLPAVAQGVVERIDCMNGVEDLHARMALEARGGRITSFA